jgi:hypothetical protein
MSRRFRCARCSVARPPFTSAVVRRSSLAASVASPSFGWPPSPGSSVSFGGPGVGAVRPLSGAVCSARAAVRCPLRIASRAVVARRVGGGEQFRHLHLGDRALVVSC